MRLPPVHPYTSFAEPNFFFSDYPRRFDDGLELYKQYFHASAEFGARFFVLDLGNQISLIPGHVQPPVKLPDVKISETG